jgi:hypothetical protein
MMVNVPHLWLILLVNCLSIDGIVDCSICGPFLIEIKCMFSHQNFHPSSALLALTICEKNGDELEITKQHKYNIKFRDRWE